MQSGLIVNVSQVGGRFQSLQLPDVTRVDVDVNKYQSNQTSYMPQVDPIQQCNPCSLPTEAWQSDFMNSFSELKTTIEALKCCTLERSVPVPVLRNRSAWLKFCVGYCNQTDDDLRKRKLECARLAGIEFDEDPSAASVIVEHEVDDDFDEHPSNVTPTVSLLLQFDQVLTQRIIKYLIEHIGERFACLSYCSNNSFKKYFVCRSQITPQEGLWLFSLLANLEKPLDCDVSALIRQLYRICCRLNSEMQTGDGFGESAAVVNIISVICGSYFGQAEVSQPQS